MNPEVAEAAKRLVENPKTNIQVHLKEVYIQYHKETVRYNEQESEKNPEYLQILDNTKIGISFMKKNFDDMAKRLEVLQVQGKFEYYFMELCKVIKGLLEQRHSQREQSPLPPTPFGATITSEQLQSNKNMFCAIAPAVLSIMLNGRNLDPEELKPINEGRKYRGEPLISNGTDFIFIKVANNLNKALPNEIRELEVDASTKAEQKWNISLFWSGFRNFWDDTMGVETRSIDEQILL